MRRIHICNDYDGLYGKFWSSLGQLIQREEFLRDPGNCDLVCFTGGEDVSPELYKHRNLASHNNHRRDELEVKLFTIAQEFSLPMTGICRGSQFLNVMCGGTMVQHLQRDHGGANHVCETLEGQKFPVTSSHHQMSVLGEGGIFLAWAEKRLSPRDLIYDGDIPKSVLDPNDPELVRVTEAFSYPERRVFACQHHPEWQNPKEKAWDWTLNQIKKVCWGEQ